MVLQLSFYHFFNHDGCIYFVLHTIEENYAKTGASKKEVLFYFPMEIVVVSVACDATTSGIDFDIYSIAAVNAN